MPAKTTLIWQVDAFTDRPFTGNPAGVCICDSQTDAPFEEELMRKLALEMNCSETAFVTRGDRAKGFNFGLRWFTPKKEIKLCGHATLSAAHILWEEGIVPAGEAIQFTTLSGILGAQKKGDWITLDFPAKETTAAELPGLSEALGVAASYTGRSEDVWLVETDSHSLRTAKPDFQALLKLDGRGFILTSKSDRPEFDFLSRYFAPLIGVPEDPVTGSAHTRLTPYWARKLGKTTMNAWQASERGGRLAVTTAGDRVLISGTAITVLKGTIVIPEPLGE